jgi:hypothetical protein
MAEAVTLLVLLELQWNMVEASMHSPNLSAAIHPRNYGVATSIDPRYLQLPVSVDDLMSL